MAGIIGVGQDYRTNAMASMKKLSELEQQRDQEKKAEKAAETQQTVSMVGMGAMAGSYFGPIGTVVGGAIGYLLSEVF